MKPETHPEYHPVVFVDGDDEIVTRSTLTSRKTREIDGVEHYVVSLDISAFSHPFYTGKQKLVDTEGRVDRFRKRYKLDEEDVQTADEVAEAAEEEEAEEEEAEEEEAEEEEAEEEEAEEEEAEEEEADSEEEE